MYSDETRARWRSRPTRCNCRTGCRNIKCGCLQKDQPCTRFCRCDWALCARKGGDERATARSGSRSPALCSCRTGYESIKCGCLQRQMPCSRFCRCDYTICWRQGWGEGGVGVGGWCAWRRGRGCCEGQPQRSRERPRERPHNENPPPARRTRPAWTGGERVEG